MLSLNQMGLQVMFNDLIKESTTNNSVEFNEYVYSVLDSYKESYENEEGTDTVRVAYQRLSDLF